MTTLHFNCENYAATSITKHRLAKMSAKSSSFKSVRRNVSDHLGIVLNVDSYDKSDKDSKQTKGKNADDLIFSGECFADQEALRRCLSPLIAGLKLMGAYYVDVKEGDSGCHATAATSEKCCLRKKILSSRTYAIVVLCMLWSHVLRYLTVFTTQDSFGPVLVIKLITVATMILCTLLHTSYFIASYNGTLDAILNEIRISPDCLPMIRKSAIFQTVKCLAFLAVYLVFLPCQLPNVLHQPSTLWSLP